MPFLSVQFVFSLTFSTLIDNSSSPSPAVLYSSQCSQTHKLISSIFIVIIVIEASFTVILHPSAPIHPGCSFLMPKGYHPGIFFDRILWIISHRLFLCWKTCFLYSMSFSFVAYSIILVVQFSFLKMNI